MESRNHGANWRIPLNDLCSAALRDVAAVTEASCDGTISGDKHNGFKDRQLR